MDSVVKLNAAAGRFPKIKTNRRPLLFQAREFTVRRWRPEENVFKWELIKSLNILKM